MSLAALQVGGAVSGIVVAAVYALVVLTFIAGGVYIGVLRALDVYFDEESDSLFLSGDSDPPG